MGFLSFLYTVSKYETIWSVQNIVKEHKETFMPDSLRDYCDVYLNEMQNKKHSGDAHHFFTGTTWI